MNANANDNASDPVSHESPETILENLNQIDRVDPTTGAMYRHQAQDLLADPEVSLTWRQAIAERLNLANRQLGKPTAVANDSY